MSLLLRTGLGLLLVLLGLLGLLASQWLPGTEVPPTAEPGRHRVSVVETRAVVPGPGLPEGLALGASNNNLDVVRHGDGRVYLAFRTAPHHFANPETRIVVLRSADEEQWELDAVFSLGRDLREPRLLSHGDGLLLVVSRLGRDPLAFQPEGMSRAWRTAAGQWSDLEPFGAPGALGWRLRRLDGVPALVAYRGGEASYRQTREPMRIDLWRGLDDGTGRLDWRLWDPQHGPLYSGGGGEADLARTADDDYFGVIRVEGGDERGWGARLCRAPAEHPARWRCRSVPRKFDSPFAFAHDGEVYLLGRRHLRGEGHFDRGLGPRTGPLRALRTIWNHAGYSFARKRCALWRFVDEGGSGDSAEGVRLAWILDLPSRGDTCFPSARPGDVPGEWIVYDYSSPLEGPDLRWIQGQRGETRIYRHVLRFRAEGPTT